MTKDTTQHNELDVTLGPQWRRLEVDGHYVGMVDVDSGMFCLYYRGKTEWYSLAEMRQKQQK